MKVGPFPGNGHPRREQQTLSPEEGLGCPQQLAGTEGWTRKTMQGSELQMQPGGEACDRQVTRVRHRHPGRSVPAVQQAGHAPLPPGLPQWDLE